MNATERASIPIGSDTREQSWAILGVDYEDRVVSKLARQRQVHLNGSEICLPTAITNAFLRGEGSKTFAAQVNVRPKQIPSVFGEIADFNLRDTFADLVRRDCVDGKPSFTVIDIKATRAARSFHKTQVAYYAILLSQVLSERKIEGTVSPFGEIWRIPDDGDASGDAYQIDSFPLAPYIRLVESFVGQTLPKIAAREVSPGTDETFFHLYFKCEQCAYLTHCLTAIDPERPPNKRDVSAVAGLSHEGKRALLDHGIRSVKSLAERAQGIGKMDGVGWSLSRRAEQLIARARAINAGHIQAGAEEQTFLMPPRSDVSIYLLADHDPVDDGLATLGYLLVRDGTVEETIKVLPTADRKAEADALIEVFSKVIADLQIVDAHNQALSDDDSGALFAHIYLYEPSEANALQNAVKRHLSDARIRTGLLHLVRIFPPEELVPEPEFRGMNHLPATAVRTVIEQLFAVPTAVSYDLRQVSQAMANDGFIQKPYAPSEPFHRPFSSLLSIEVTRGIREGRKDHVAIADVEDDVRGRLNALCEIVQWLQKDNRDRTDRNERPTLRLNKLPFRLQATFDPLEAGDLDILRALELLENRAGMLDTLIRLAKPASSRRDSGNAIGPLFLIGINKTKMGRVFVFRRPAEAMDVDLEGGLGLVLSDGSPDVLLDPRRWPDLSCQLMDPGPNDDTGMLRVGVWNSVFDSPTMKDLVRRLDKDGWWIDRTFVDFNSPKVARFIDYLAGEAA